MFDSIGNPIPASHFAPIDHQLHPNHQNQYNVDSNEDSKRAGTISDNHDRSTSKQELSPDEKKQLQELKTRDQEVKAHEAAHQAAAGGLATSGASFTYETGPDGQRYAVSGEVSIDVSSASTPEATIEKMEQVKRAALAPADPSATDHAVAASASQKQAQAKADVAQEDQSTKPEENGKIGSYHEDLTQPAETFNKFV